MRDGDPPLVTEAYLAWNAEDWSRAGQLLEQAVLADPDGPRAAVWWFDAALAHKFLRNWPKAYELGLQAAARAPRGQQDPAFWNLGIAATVLREWDTARDAWRGYGIPVADGTGEITDGFGTTCLRIRTDSGDEVVWAQRLCPTRARVTSVPFDPSRRFGEVVLHDGAPNGERYIGDRRFPVFDELMLFTPSIAPTLAAQVTAATAADTEELIDAGFAHGVGVEVLTGRDLMCKCCSEGRVDVERDVRGGEQTMLFGGTEEQTRQVLQDWAAAAPAARSWTGLHALS
ncbi:tetratricopeptide repeat protein [Catellatospora paridis]|uniref:tetratricopeptide repeat protein n=1 Tax=Catellatospora paridis TaxID=1617086 RepID=UPI0012D49B53|nr:tetratricopeptide repeat protein [Catellatospora paridis]